MTDFLDTFFGAKRKSPKRRSKSPKRKSTKRKSTKRKSVGKVMVKGRGRTVYKSKTGSLFYIKNGKKVYVDKSRVRKSLKRKSPKRSRKSPKRSRKSPKRARKSPKRSRKSPKRARKASRKSKYGIPAPKDFQQYGGMSSRNDNSIFKPSKFGSGSFLGGPSTLMQMMGPSNLKYDLSGSDTVAPASKPVMNFGF